MKIVREIVEINPDSGCEVVQYKCPICGKVLAEVTYGSTSYIVHGVDDCEHFEWEHYGNTGWELYGDARKYVMVLYGGTSVYALRARKHMRRYEELIKELERIANELDHLRDIVPPEPDRVIVCEALAELTDAISKLKIIVDLNR